MVAFGLDEEAKGFFDKGEISMARGEMHVIRNVSVVPMGPTHFFPGTSQQPRGPLYWLMGEVVVDSVPQLYRRYLREVIERGWETCCEIQVAEGVIGFRLMHVYLGSTREMQRSEKLRVAVNRWPRLAARSLVDRLRQRHMLEAQFRRAFELSDTEVAYLMRMMWGYQGLAFRYIDGDYPWQMLDLPQRLAASLERSNTQDPVLLRLPERLRTDVRGLAYSIADGARLGQLYIRTVSPDPA